MLSLSLMGRSRSGSEGVKGEKYSSTMSSDTFSKLGGSHCTTPIFYHYNGLLIIQSWNIEKDLTIFTLGESSLSINRARTPFSPLKHYSIQWMTRYSVCNLKLPEFHIPRSNCRKISRLFLVLTFYTLELSIDQVFEIFLLGSIGFV